MSPRNGRRAADLTTWKKGEGHGHKNNTTVASPWKTGSADLMTWVKDTATWANETHAATWGRKGGGPRAAAGEEGEEEGGNR